jgi:hypothetical protein
MLNLAKPSLIVLLLSVLCILPGCASLFPCVKASPFIEKGLAYAQEAQTSLDQIEAAENLLPLTDAQKRDVAVLLEKARIDLRGGQQALMAANDACTSPDLISAFAQFVADWTAIEALLAKNVDPTGKLQAKPMVMAPMVVLMSRKAAVQ